jgi:hypothetical protein
MSTPNLFYLEENQFNARSLQITSLRRGHHPLPLLDRLALLVLSLMMPLVFLVLPQDSGAMQASSVRRALTVGLLVSLHLIPADRQLNPDDNLQMNPDDNLRMCLEADHEPCMPEKRPGVGHLPRLERATRLTRYARPRPSGLRRAPLGLLLHLLLQR